MSIMNHVGNLLNRNYEMERYQIQKDLQNIVRECKEKYANKTELATESDSRILRLSDCWEILLFHGLKTNIFKATASFWDIAYQHLTRHEKERFSSLRHVHTDRGKFRALLRAALNERSLERYVLMWINDETLMEKYEPYACLLDRHTMGELPKLANSLNNILFALTIDTPELNIDRKLNILEKEEPIIPVKVPTNLEGHKRPKNIRRKVVEIEETGNLSVNKAVPESGRTPSPNYQMVIENGNIPRNPSPKTVLNQSIRSFTEHELIDNQIQNTSMNSSIQSFNSTSSGNQTFEEDKLRKISIPSQILNLNDVPEETGVEMGEDSILSSKGSSIHSNGSQEFLHGYDMSHDIEVLRQKLKEKEERCAQLENQVAELSLENCRLRMLSNPSRYTKIYFNVTIPRAFLEAVIPTGKKYYIYEINVTPANDIMETWIVKRRYSEFYSLHKQMSTNNHMVKTLDFPPKKKSIFGNMDAGFVEQRRQRLQVYLKHLITILQEVAECCTRSELTRTFPFLDPDVKFS